MSELIFVTTDNCELCKKAQNKIKFLKPFYEIREVDVHEDLKEYLIRVPVLLKNNKVIEDFILNDRVEGTKNFKVNATPTIIINNEKFEKSLNYKNLKKTLEKLI